MNDVIFIMPEEMRRVFKDRLIKHGVGNEEASQIAEVFTINASDGIITHSVNRFSRLIQQIDLKVANPGVLPRLISEYGALIRYDARLGIGTTSGTFAMNMASEKAAQYGVGIVSLSNANHWMRAGYYSLLAAGKGQIGICWTNTMHNLASWGSREANIGNNPLSIAIPHSEGSPFLIDSAMSQFSVGKVSQYAEEGKKLPVIGGFDTSGNLTNDAAEILSSWRFLPAGYWKGSGFSILLDAMAAILSNGRTVAEIGDCDALHEAGLSQVFIAIDFAKLGDECSGRVLSSIEDSLKKALPVSEDTPVRYPGENLMKTRDMAKRNGVKVPLKTWNEILQL